MPELTRALSGLFARQPHDGPLLPLEGGPSRSSRASVLVGWMVIGVATTIYFGGAYSPTEIALVGAGTVLIGWAVISHRRPYFGELGTRVVLVAMAALVLTISIWRPAGLYGYGSSLVISHEFTSVAAGLLLFLALLGLRDPDRAAILGYLVIAVMLAAGVFMIVSSPKPAIDVWFMYQSATHAIMHGHNIYTNPWTSGVQGESSNIFTYLPGSAVFLAPFHEIFGDVRYGVLAAMGLTAFILMQVTRRSRLGPVAPCLVLLYPKALFGVEQSWIDPLVLCAVSISGYLVLRKRIGWAVVCFAACLTIKQTAWALVPLAALWRPFGWRRAGIAVLGALAAIAPWALAAPRAFDDGMKYNVTTVRGRIDALSLNAVALRHGTSLSPLIALGCVSVVILISAYFLPHTAGGFLLASGFTVSVFNLTYKLAFFNEWSLAAGMAIAGFVFWRPDAPDDPRTGQFVDANVAATRARNGIYNPAIQLKSSNMALVRAWRAEAQ